MLQERDGLLTELQENLSRAQQQMKGSADKHWRDVEYTVADWVFLKLMPYM